MSVNTTADLELPRLPQRAMLATFNRRIGSAVNGLRTPSRSVRQFNDHAARE